MLERRRAERRLTPEGQKALRNARLIKRLALRQLRSGFKGEIEIVDSQTARRTKIFIDRSWAENRKDSYAGAMIFFFDDNREAGDGVCNPESCVYLYRQSGGFGTRAYDFFWFVPERYPDKHPSIKYTLSDCIANEGFEGWPVLSPFSQMDKGVIKRTFSKQGLHGGCLGILKRWN